MSGFTLIGQEISWLETIAFLTGLLGVGLTIRKHLLNFPVGILNVLIYCYLFLQDNIRLYADALLQLIFAIVLIYGWVKWSSGLEKNKRIKSTTRAEWITITLGTSLVWLVTGLLLCTFTRAAVPWLDAALTAASLTAQWMIAQKRKENWLIWMAVNAVYVPLYLYKQLPLTALLYSIFLIMALQGWRSWNTKTI